MARKYVFNLLQPLQTPKTYWDKIYDWLVSQAKMVLLIIEILIVIAFVSKVVVDNVGKNRKQAYDILNTEITTISSNNESAFRNIQTKDGEYNKLWANASEYKDVLLELTSYLDFNNTVSISVDKLNVTISGFQALEDIRNLETNMKASETFDQVLANLSLNEQDVQDNFAQFTINATLVEDAIKREPINSQ